MEMIPEFVDGNMKETEAMKSNMNEATSRRMEEAVDRVLELLIDELEIEPFAMRLEPDENSFTAFDVLCEAIVSVIIVGIYAKVNLPPPPATEIFELCAKLFLEKAAN
jgi:hypothetical protein